MIPYTNPEELFNDYCKLIRGLTLRYIRLNSTRFIDDDADYDPRNVSSMEFLESIGAIKCQEGDRWLDEHNFPDLESINAYISDSRRYLEMRLNSTETPIGLEALRRQFSLSEFEVRVLAAVIGAQVDDTISRYFRFVSGEQNSTIFTAGFFAQILTSSTQEYRQGLVTLGKSNKLSDFHLIELGLHEEWKSKTPTLFAPITVPERIVSFVLGHSDIEEPLIACQHVTMLNELDKLIIPKAIANQVYEVLKEEKPRIGLFGRPSSGRRSLLYGIAKAQNRELLEIDMSTLHADMHTPETIKGLFASWFREAYLTKAYLLFRMDKPLETEFENMIMSIISTLATNLQGFNGCICVSASAANKLTRLLFGELSEILFPPPSAKDQQMFWECTLRRYMPTEKADTLAELLSIGYCLTPGEVETAVAHTLIRVQNDVNALDTNTLSETLHKTRGQQLEGLAEYRSTALTLKDVVLTEKAMETVKNIINHSRYSEKVRNDWGFAKYAQSAVGLSVLFSGPPGTGKTLTASVLAHELRRALYVVDISRIVDKYVGETEKNLARIFDHAENSQAVLLFDECDSLFAKRTSVKSSNDRYANLEVNYLLQRLESYSGISILTTNFAASLDEALSRRIQFKVEFPQPDSKQRAELWKRIVPAKAPKEKIDYKALGEHFDMSGGHIKNAVFRGCIFAASHQSPLTTDFLWEAALQEYREMGHVVCDEEGEYT